MVMELEEPTVNLDEFAWIKNPEHRNKLAKSNLYFIRKRSYSKEDVQINSNKIFGTGANSPEFVISDEDEYRIKDDSEISWKRSKKGNNFK